MNRFLDKFIIGVDLGGTKVNVGLVKNNDIISNVNRKLPKDSKDEWDVINLIIEVIKELKGDYDIAGIGVGVPSILDRKQGIIHEVQNIPTWKEVPLAKILQNKFELPVYIDNDANCFALGEYHFGKGKHCPNMVGVTLGTGMGSGIITNHQLMGDSNGGSGEFGMIPYIDGIVEDYCSGKFFKNNTNLTGEAIYQAALNGDSTAINLYKTFGSHLGNAISIILYALDPEKIIIGGSIAQSSEFFYDAVKERLQDFTYKKVRDNIEIEFSDNPDIAILGAAALVIQNE